jgi:hypothetical protein
MLSPNDAGETNTHQAGILIPKNASVLAFFPELDSTAYNPRAHLIFYDAEAQRWLFNFIYYNNASFGKTRNEYRLTGLTKYIRANNLHSGDTIILYRSDTNRYDISYQRQNAPQNIEAPIILSSNWKIVSL